MSKIQDGQRRPFWIYAKKYASFYPHFFERPRSKLSEKQKLRSENQMHM